MDSFFGHEHHAWPPSLASNGIMHQTSASNLMECLECVVPKLQSVPDVDVKTVDGAVIVRILDPNKSQVSVKTFHDYAQLVFMPYIKRMLQDVVRVDVVWEPCIWYSPRVSNSTNVHIDWKSFLRCDANKDSLFHLLADAIREFHPPQRKQVISTYWNARVRN